MHAECFPGEVADDEPDAAFWDRVTACHDEDAITWFLLFDDDGPAIEAEGSAHEMIFDAKTSPPPPPPAPRPLIGFAAATPYTASLYGMHLGVTRRHRGRGHGAWIMREAQCWAHERGYPKVQATVERASTRLMKYYASLGATVVETGFGGGGGGGGGGEAGSIVRVERVFDEVIATTERDASRAHARALESSAAAAAAGSGAGTRRRRAAGSGAASFAAGAVVAMLLRRRR